jgi:PhoH-like ATPase
MIKKSNDSVVIDTNILLDDPKILFKLTNKYDQIVIPITVLKELDKHKFKADTSFSAREAIRVIREFKNNYRHQIEFDLSGMDAEFDNSNDGKIIKSAKVTDSTIATKDVSMEIISEALGLETQLYDVVMNNLFDPYVYIEQDELFKHNPEGTFGYSRVIEGLEYIETFDLFAKTSGRDNLQSESWFFVIISEYTGKPIVYANNPIKSIFQRIDNDGKYCKIADSKKKGKAIKARDIYQKCAIYALKEAQHVLITGRWGSGKSLLATAQTLYREDKKVFVSRAPVGLNSKYNLGFMPGSKEDKMQDWLAGFMSALYYLYANTRGQNIENGGYDHVKDVLYREKLEPIAMNSIQGLSLLDNDTLIVDEVQLIDVAYLSMIMSRPSESGRLILLGDLGQTYDVVRPSESGLLKLLRVLPHKSLAYVDLKTSYRSDIIEIADLLQDKTMG